MPNYRVDVWLQHKQEDFEDQLEEIIRPLLRDNKMTVQGLVAYRVYPFGDQEPFPCPTIQNTSPTVT